MKPTLYIMCGAPGCGKTTWAWNFRVSNDDDIRYVSRDDIRFNIIKDDEPYFSHEKEVYKKFIGTIAHTLIDGLSVIADATHLNRASRQKLFNALDAIDIDYNTICVCLPTSLERCLQHNKQRTGRSCVPEENLKQMFRSLEWPTFNEHESIKEIWKIERREYNE